MLFRRSPFMTWSSPEAATTVPTLLPQFRHPRHVHELWSHTLANDPFHHKRAEAAFHKRPPVLIAKARTPPLVLTQGEFLPWFCFHTTFEAPVPAVSANPRSSNRQHKVMCSAGIP